MTTEMRPTVVPALRYVDGNAAVDWLCRAFGFVPHLVVRNEEGQVVHAQLLRGNGMVMLGSGGHGAYDAYVKSPVESGAPCSQGIYVVVQDADEHYRRARAEGAEIVLELEDQSYGGRGYTCRDPEGHVWSFGTYDPWADPR
ncbi:MAG: hypothetical protein KatS3mg076_2114 [Candidatus Binatia bacterium]|nr:MAG: hypothetical protein KatS3mg076_2114 [Candidatus Binatia bacterium]